VVRRLADVLGSGAAITVWNRSRQDFNRILYQDLAAVRVVPVWNIVELCKDPASGEVSMAGTLARLGDYALLRDRYPGGGEAEGTDPDVVLDFGVPPAVRWARKKGIPSVTLFDHAWSRTLEMILEAEGRMHRPGGTGAAGKRPGPEGERLIRALREDEARVERLFVFPPFLTPPVFRRFWESIGVRPADTRAVFGGRPGRTRREARTFLGLEKPGPTVLVLAGDTPVWDAALLRLSGALVARARWLEDRGVNVVLYVPGRLREHEAVMALDRAGHDRVRRLVYVPGGTVQEILPAVDLVLTRAGGGMVNDAVACRVPLVCVPERTQPQVEAILAACVDRGLAREADAALFARDPLRVLLAEADRTAENRAVAGRMEHVPTGGEAVVARAVLELLGRSG